MGGRVNPAKTNKSTTSAWKAKRIDAGVRLFMQTILLGARTGVKEREKGF